MLPPIPSGNKLRTLILAGTLFNLLPALPVAGQSTLVSDSFNRSGALNGSSPDVTTNGALWVAKTGTGAATANGGALTLPGSNQTNSLDLGAGYFSANPGVYTLTATINVGAGVSSLNNFGIGFVVNPITTTNLGNASSSTGLNPSGGTNGGTPWIYLTQSGSLYVNRDGTNFIYFAPSATYPSGSAYTVGLVLDTSGAQWKLDAYVNGVQLDLNGGSTGKTYIYSTNPSNIRYVAVTSATSSVSATMDNFSLTGPSAASTPPPLPQFDAVLIDEKFDGSGALNGLVPGTTTNGAAWIARTGTNQPNVSGGTLSLPASNQTAVIDLGAGTFAARPGVYTLSTDVTLLSGAPIVGIGFVVNPLLTAPLSSPNSSPGLNPAGGTNGGSPWMYYKGDGTVSVYRSPSTTIYPGAGSFTTGVPHKLKLVLDTTQPAWVVSAYIDSTQLDLDFTTSRLSYTLPSTPAIRYVAVTTGLGTGPAVIDNFKLTCVMNDALAALGDFAAPGVTPGVRPYNDMWIEGELYTGQAGGTTTADTSAYGGSKWTGDSVGDSVTYTVNAPVAGAYLLNIAGTKIGDPGAASIACAIDGGPAIPITGGSSAAGTWSGGLVWNVADIVNFTTAGSHTITLSLTGPGSFTVDALSLVADPLNNLLFNLSNFARSQIWGSSISASSGNTANPAANALSGNPGIGWRPTIASPTPSTLTVTFSGERTLEALRLVKGLNAPSGASMPTAYKIELNEGGAWVTRVDETANLKQQVIYPFPAAIKATALRLTVTGTQGNNYPFVNQLEAYGQFAPSIAAPLHRSEVVAGSCNVYGYAQPNATISLRLNGNSGPVVTANSAGWFSANVSLASGSNVIQAQASSSGVKSSWRSSLVERNSATASYIAVSDRKGFAVIGNEGTNLAVIHSAGQGTSVPYVVKNETGATVSSGNLDLSKSNALLTLPASSAGWYDITLSGSPALTRSISVLPNQFVLPAESGSGVNTVLGPTTTGKLPLADQGSHLDVVTAYTSSMQTGWVREGLAWGTGINPAAGVYEWDAVDRELNAFLNQGQKILLNINLYPGFLNNRPADVAYFYPPDDLRSTYAFGKALGAHYQGRVSAYEFQNESDWASGSKTTVNGLMAHQRAFYLGLKSADPSAIVAPSPMAFVMSVPNQIQNLRGEAFDALAFHWYPQGSGAGQISNLVTGSYNLPSDMASLISMLDGRAAWNSECGYYAKVPGSSGNPGSLPFADEQYQADFYSKMTTLAMASGIDRVFGFCFPFYWETVSPTEFKHFGQLRHAGFAPTPSVNSAAVTNQFLRGSEYIGSLDTGNPDIIGLIFVKPGGVYSLQIWAKTAAAAGSYTLPGGVTKTLAMDYMGRITDTGSSSTINLQTTAKYLQLSGASVASVTTLNNPSPNPSLSGIAPSKIVMGWRVDRPVRSIAFKDCYDMAPGSSTAANLEIVNLGTSAFSGTVNLTRSNNRWSLTPGASLAVSIPAGGRTVIPCTVTASSFAKDDLRIEARVVDGAGQASVAADTFQTTGTTPLLAASVPDSDGTITFASTGTNQAYLGWDGFLNWVQGSEGGVSYVEAARATGAVTYTPAQLFKAPRLDYKASLTTLSTYYIWVKAKGAATGSNRVNIGVGGKLLPTATEITGFSSASWKWSRTTVSGTATFVTDHTTAERTINVWPSNSGIKIAGLIVTTDPSLVPETVFTEYFVDNASTGNVTATGAWTIATTTPGFFGSNYQHDAASGKGTKSFRFTPNLPTAGTYEVFARWPAGSNRATNVPFDIIHSGGTTTEIVNQQQNNNVWKSLGTYTFFAGSAGGVLIRNAGTPNGYFVMADVVKFRKK